MMKNCKEFLQIEKINIIFERNGKKLGLGAGEVRTVTVSFKMPEQSFRGIIVGEINVFKVKK